MSARVKGLHNLMNEARFSANFRIPNPQGIETQFTVRTDEGAATLLSDLQALHDRLLSAGYGAQQASGSERTFECVGIVVGQFKDSKENKYRNCMHLYAPQGKFKQTTVYPEKVAELPRWVVETVNAARKAPVLQAPDRDTAEGTGVMIHLPRPFKVVMALRVDHDNQPILTQDGKKQYRVDRFIELQGGTTAPEPVETEPVANTQDIPF